MNGAALYRLQLDTFKFRQLYAGLLTSAKGDPVEEAEAHLMMARHACRCGTDWVERLVAD